MGSKPHPHFFSRGVVICISRKTNGPPTSSPTQLSSCPLHKWRRAIKHCHQPPTPNKRSTTLKFLLFLHASHDLVETVQVVRAPKNDSHYPLFKLRAIDTEWKQSDRTTPSNVDLSWHYLKRNTRHVFRELFIFNHKARLYKKVVFRATQVKHRAMRLSKTLK